MKCQYHDTFKIYFNKKLIKTRKHLGVTQKRMAEKLGISVRSYQCLEKGKYCCSGDVFAMFLAFCINDPSEFINSFRGELFYAIQTDYMEMMKNIHK